MSQKDRTYEAVFSNTERKTAKALRSKLLKTMAKDKKSDALNLEYRYKPLKREATYTLTGHKKTVAACMKVVVKFGKVLLKKQKKAEKKEAKKAAAKPKYYKYK